MYDKRITLDMDHPPVGIFRVVNNGSDGGG